MIPRYLEGNVRLECSNCKRALTIFKGKQSGQQFRSVVVEGNHLFNGTNFNSIHYILMRCASCAKAGIAKIHVKAKPSDGLLEFFHPFSAVFPKSIPDEILNESHRVNLLIDGYIKDWSETSLQSLDDNIFIKETKDLLKHNLEDIKEVLENSLIKHTSIKVRKLAKLLLAKTKKHQIKNCGGEKRIKTKAFFMIDSYIKNDSKLNANNLKLLHKYQKKDLCDILFDEFRNNEDTEVKYYALRLLGNLEEPNEINNAINYLREELKRTEDTSLKYSIIRVLYKLKDPRAENYALEELKRTKDSKVKRSIIRGIKNSQSPDIIPVLKDMYQREIDDEIREDLIKALYRANKEDALELLKDALIYDESETVRKRAAILLGRTKNKWDLTLLSNALLDDKNNKNIAKEIVIGLKGGGKHISDLFLNVLENDHDLEVKIEAVKGLGYISDNRAYDPLLKIIDKEENVEFKATAIRAIGAIRDLRAIDAIIPYLKDEDKDLRISSVYALGELGSGIAVKYLCDLSNDQNIDVRIALVNALRKIRDPSAIKPLMNLLDDKNEDIKTTAAIALAYFGEPCVFSVLLKALENVNIAYAQSKNNMEIRYYNKAEKIIKSLGALGDKRAVPYILDQLEYGENRIKEISIICLGLLGDKQAIPHLENLLKDKRSNIRFRAGIVLGYFKVKAAYSVICEALKSKTSYDRAGAVRSLAELNGKKYIDLIISTTKDSNTKVRKTALNVFMDVARTEMAFLANYLDLSSIPKSDINEDKLPKTEILDAFEKDYFKKMKIDANRIDVNIIYKILLMIGYIEKRSEITQKLDAIKKEIKPEKDSKLHIFQKEEYETEEIIIDDAWFDKVLDTNAIKNHYNTRPKQQVFRENVLKCYGGYCAVCGIRVPELLIAAHIIEKKYNGVDDPRNALVLCALHHKAFDSGLFGIEPDTLEIYYKPKGPKANDLNIRYENIDHLHNKPHPDVLRWRWNCWQKMLNEEPN